MHDLQSRVARDEQRAGGAKRDAGQLAKKVLKAQAALEQVGGRGGVCVGVCVGEPKMS